MQLLQTLRSTIITAVALGAALFCAGAVGSLEGADALRTRYQTLIPALEKNVFDAPLYVESEDRQSRIRGEVFGVVYHGIDALRVMVASPPEWCELLLLHHNVKFCAHQAASREDVVITIYTGGKNYASIEETRRNDYRVRVHQTTGDYLKAEVAAERGPLDTSDYYLVLETVPIDSGRSFVHVGFSYRYGPLTRALTATYFSTLGRSKIGFSIVGQNPRGEPVFVRGRSASLERTVMRVYLALQTWLEGRLQPQASRFEWRLRRWYALTERYPRQLHEFEEDDYLDTKLRERAVRLPPQHELRPTFKN